MAFKSLLSLVGVCLFVSSFSLNAAFIGRDLDGDNTTAEAYYDTILDITWLADANINGANDWTSQVAWATGLSFGIATNWRLPNMDINTDNTIVNCSTSTLAECKDNEYGHLYYYGAGATLGNGITPSTAAPFDNVQSGIYWSGTPFSNPNAAYGLDFDTGTVIANAKTDLNFAMAVHDGIVGEVVVPVPAAAWLFGSGFIGLFGLARRKARI
jgi:hypothetical protein